MIIRLFFVICLLCSVACADNAYFIGNSLTNSMLWRDVVKGDTVYELARAHLRGSGSLKNIFADPTSTGSLHPWDSELYATQYDLLSVQPYREDDLTDTIDIVEFWADLQPDATILIHTGWAPWADIDAQWDDETTSAVRYSPKFFSQFYKRVQRRLPGREVLIDNAYAWFHFMAHDPDLRFHVSGLYQDHIHTNTSGSYFAHNLMRQTIGIGYPYTESDLSPSDRKYLDRLLENRIANQLHSRAAVFVVVFTAAVEDAMILTGLK